MSDAPALPRFAEGYYLENFRTVLAEVESRYGDLLHPPEHAVLGRFRALSLPAQRLLVRLLTRKGPWFRRDRLRYREIGDPGPPAEELVAAGFAEEDASLAEFLPLLTRADLLRALAAFRIPAAKGARRDALLELLLERVDEAALLAHLRAALQPLRLALDGLWRTLFLLFFGNFEQDLSSFVIVEVGHVRFEDYPIDPAARLFRTREDVDFLLAIRGLREQLETAAGLEELAAITDQALAMQNHPGVRQQRRYHGLLNALGQAWERTRDLDRSWACYARSARPPAAERRTRIAAARGDLEGACRLALELAEAPRDVGEERFARSFLRRLRRKVPRAAAWVQAHPEPAAIPVRSLGVSLRTGRGVEALALEAARAEGWDGFFAENLLWRGLFGLALWEAVFADVPGAFQHRFQSAPLDLGPDFLEARRSLIEARLAELATAADLAATLLPVFDRKRGLANPFVNWRHLERASVEAAAARIEPAVLAAVCRHMARNPLAFDSGFPDLFLYRPEGLDWRLWEVKGPHDRLRPEQEAWLQRFRALGVDAEVARIG